MVFRLSLCCSDVLSPVSIKGNISSNAAIASGTKWQLTGGQNGVGKLTHLMGTASQSVHFYYRHYEIDGFTNAYNQWVAVDPVKRDQYGVRYWIRCWTALKARYTTDAGTYVDVPIQLHTTDHTSDGDDVAEGHVPTTYSPIPIPAEWKKIP